MIDQLFINGYVHGIDGIEHSLGVTDGIISSLGKQDKLIIDGIEVIDLQGGHVYPGFIDAHIHMLSYCWKKFHEVDLSSAKSHEDIVLLGKKFIKDNKIKAGEWIIGSGWNHENFDRKELPNREVLDQISTKHPIIFNRTCYHICVVNSLALKMAGIDKKAVIVEGGSMDVNGQGLPTGILRENAECLVADLKPALTDKNVMKELIIKGCYALANVGITTVHTDDFAFVGDKQALWEAYYELASEHKLPIKVVLQLRVSSIEDVDFYHSLQVKSWMNVDNLRVGPVKIIADGSLGARTAALEEEYSDEQGNKGILVYSNEDLEHMISCSFLNGFDMAVHAIGDRTMTIVLDIYEKYNDLIQLKDFRPSIIHCQIGSRSIIERMKKLDIIANIQPIFMGTDWSIAKERVGIERIKYSYCWKKYLNKGIHLVGSSDAPIESFNPLLGIYSAVTRCDMAGKPFGGWMPEECLTVQESIGLFTYRGAYASKEEVVKGELNNNMQADFVVLSHDLEHIDSMNIKDVKVLATYVNGIKVEAL